MTEKNILLLDDDPVFLDVTARALKRRDHLVFTAGNLAQAEQLAQQEALHYAVIDLKIDQESGLDCLPMLKKYHPGIRMLILTGYSSIATAVTAIKAGAVDYACKPLDVDEILAILCGEKTHENAIKDEPVSVERLQWEHIQRVLEVNKGNISATARQLGMHRRTLQRKLQKRPVRS
ncbi:MAG: two-component system response regulator [Gammaproteobacteria bacterium]|nr:two-component system response regulator [Gammaproteobacteria bacterium]|tara:strand:+ start:108267 stop:108797 length:531 start_codon:yes stop_codon:yes gene_type:complete